MRKILLLAATLGLVAIVTLHSWKSTAPLPSRDAEKEKAFDNAANDKPISVSKQSKTVEVVPRRSEKTTPDFQHEELLRHIAQAWAARNPSAALAWAAQIKNPDERTETLTHVVFQIAEANPSTAINVARKFQLGDAPGEIIPTLAQHWAESDLPSALAWATSQPVGAQHDEIFARIAFVESQNDPESAANLIIAKIPAGPAQDEAALSVLHQWAMIDFDAASAWVALFPNSPLKRRALAELAGVARFRADTAFVDSQQVM